MNLNELKQEVIDLRNEMNEQFNKYVELIDREYVVDFSPIWTDRVREDRAEMFEEEIDLEIKELCESNDAFVESERYVSLEASKFLRIASDNLMYEDNLTLDRFVKHVVTSEYTDSILIDHLGKDDDFILALIDELQADDVLDDDRIESEIDQFRELVDTVKKTVSQLTTVNEGIEEINSKMKESFVNFCDNF